MPNPVASHVVIIGGPYSVSATGIWVAGASMGQVLSL
jgi:hypothetical protein